MNVRRQLILDKHLNGVDYNNGHELNEAVIAAMEEYLQEKLKILNIPVVIGRSEQLPCPQCGQLKPCAYNSPETCFHPEVYPPGNCRKN